MDAWYAKSDSYLGRPVTVRAHVRAVADLAAEFGLDAGVPNLCRLAGLTHDFGKMSPSFRAVLAGAATGVDHALPGASMLSLRGPGQSAARLRPAVEAVAAHHGRLLSEEVLAPYLWAVVDGSGGPVVGPSGRTSSMSSLAELRAAFDVFSEENPDAARVDLAVERSPVFDDSWRGSLARMLRTRMVCSCLTDADWSVSGFEASGDESLVRECEPLDVEDAIARLEAYRARVAASSTAAPAVNALRERVYEDCAAAGAASGNFWTLTAPTGSGKTLAMLRFALERMRADPSLRRVILVLPFLSLSDQVERVVGEVFGDYVVDHSRAENGEERREFVSSWNARVVVTTTVQFFEALFSDRPGDLRKLHRVANAVVVLDEVQAIPVPLSRVAVESLHELSSRYGTCVVLSTATQPAFASMPDLAWFGTSVREMIRDVPGSFAAASRTRLRFDFDVPRELESVADEAAACLSACVIVNLRRHARRVHERWRASGVEGVYLLSTDLCPSHRRAILDEVAGRLARGEPVHLAATQCVEAGVDLDFDRVFRALAPLSGLIQAAGRQNRNGRLAPGETVVFEPAREHPGERLYPGPDYERQAMVVRSLWAAGVDLNDLSGVEVYYDRVFRNFSEPPRLARALAEVDYEACARESRLIREGGRRVVVPYDADVWEDAVEALSSGRATRALLARTLGTSVQTYDVDGVDGHCSELVALNRRTGARVPTGVWVLLPGHEACYRDDVGLCFDDDAADDVFLL